MEERAVQRVVRSMLVGGQLKEEECSKGGYRGVVCVL